METVLVIGATGNIGVAMVTGALQSGRRVLAVVRNQDSADKLIKHVGSSKNLITVEANVRSETGIKEVVDKVRAGELPSFQHVFSSVGGEYKVTPLSEITTETYRLNMGLAVETNFFAYRDTISYLREQNNPNSTWTGCTGAQGDTGLYAMPAITQGALFSMYVAAARENEKTNVRFNEIYLAFRVEYDEDAIKHGVTKASDFGKVYPLLLDSPQVRGSRVRVDTEDDIKVLKYHSKF